MTGEELLKALEKIPSEQRKALNVECAYWVNGFDSDSSGYEAQKDIYDVRIAPSEWQNEECTNKQAIVLF